MKSPTVEAVYDPSDRLSLLRLVGREGFPEALWTWQFELNPRGVPFNPVMLREPRTGEPIAFNGVMPVRVVFRGEERDACWSCDFHVAAAYRGTGLGRRVKELLHQRSPLFMTFGVSPAAAVVLRRMGWHPSPVVSQYRKVRSWRRSSDWVRWLLQAAARIRARFRIHRGESGATRPHVAVSWTFPAKSLVDDLWRRVAGSYRNLVVRDHAYLAWRYGQCPVARYRFIRVSDGQTLRAIGVIRQERESTRLVDLVARADDAVARREIVTAWLGIDELAEIVQVTTSDGLLGEVLLAEGFIRGGGRPGFFVRSADGDPAAADDWFLMAGDSDGEFLQAARDGLEAARTPGRLVVRRMLDEEWLASRSAWESLLERSASDPLFMGWSWQATWWRQWAGALGLESCVLGVYRDETLVGLAPFYRRLRRRRRGLRWDELHLMGNAWGVAPTVRTEYASTVIDASWVREGVDALAVALSRLRWDVLVVSDYVMDGQPEPWFNVRGAVVVRRKLDEGVVIDTTGGFDAWLRTLGRHTRLKVYNRRRYLEHSGRPVEFFYLDDPRAALAMLNDFHRARWGKPVFTGPSLSFHLELLEELPANARLRFSALRIAGEIRSVLYDIQVGSRVYNLQAGFQEHYDPKVSLGTLHLGFAVEAAFRDPTARSYDLLAGSGKETFYKNHFQGQPVRFGTYQFVRHPLLRIAWATHLALPDFIGRATRRLLQWHRSVPCADDGLSKVDDGNRGGANP